MSKEADALVITGYGYLVSHEIHRGAWSDTAQGLWTLQNRTHWADGRSISPEEKNNLYAGDIFLHLGELAASRYHHSSGTLQNPNPLQQQAAEALDTLLPFENDEQLATILEFVDPEDLRSGSADIFGRATSILPDIKAELQEKWHQALDVYRSRGKVALQAYTLASLVGVFKEPLDAIAPDRVVFDESNQATEEIHNLSELIARTNTLACSAEFHYYQTFDAPTNGSEMLDAALEDLQELGKALRVS